MDSRVRDLIASVLQIPSSSVVDSLAFNGTPSWDSINHISLMLALETTFGIEVSDDEVVELTSAGAISVFVAEKTGGSDAPHQ